MTRSLFSTLFFSAAALLYYPTTAPAAPLIAADYILGVWTFEEPAGSYGFLAFLPNGTYVHAQTSPLPDTGGGISGVEVGTYTFAPLTDSSAILSTQVVKDDNGTWGAGNGSGAIDFQTINDKKCMIIVDDETHTVCTASTSDLPSLYNGWFSGGEVGNVSILAFFEDGRYLHAIDPLATTLEAGTFDWSSSTGILNLTDVMKFGGTDQTISELGAPSLLQIRGSELTVSGSVGSLSFSAVPLQVSEPAPILLLAPLVLALAYSRRSRAK